MNRISSSRMADIEFSSISSFLAGVESRAELKQISTSAIFSFKIPKGGVDLLIKKKQRISWDLNENNRKLSIWVEENHQHLQPLELVVLRSMYVTSKNSIELVDNQILKAEALKKMYAGVEQLALDAGEGVTDDPPF